MSDELERLIDGDDDFSKRLLSSSDADVPSDRARQAARVAIGLGVAAAPMSAAAAGTVALGTKIGLVTALGATVALGVVLSRSPEPPPAPPPAPIEVVAPEPEVEVAPEPVEPEVVVETPAPEPKKPERVAAKRPSGLEAEVRLLDRARAAHSSERYDRAMRFLRRYRSQFASGMLREEADALEVRTLADAGRTEEARRAAKKFVARYPQSSHAASFGTLLE